MGTANAVAAARLFCGSDRFIVLNSDNFYPVPALRKLHKGTPKVRMDGFHHHLNL